jgi:ABC-type oligopeptide transport system substrate-binding subunit
LDAAALSAGVALLAAAFAGVAPGGSSRSGGTLRVSSPLDVDFVDPALAYTYMSNMVLDATCAKLFRYDTTSSGRIEIVADVAGGYRISRDGRTYTFDLKPTFRFHTGRPVTAQSFADAINRAATPRMQATDAHPYLHDIAGAADVIDGKAATVSGVEALGRHRLRIRLVRPLPDLPARLTMNLFCPVAPNTPVTPSGVDDPLGSGPYYVAERIVNRRIVLRRNPYYRGARQARLDEIVWRIGELRGNACLEATEANLVDLCVGGSWSDDRSRALLAKYGLNRSAGRYFVRPLLFTILFRFNLDRPAFKGPGQVPMRQAINHVLDRPALVRPRGHLESRRTDQILPPGVAPDVPLYPIEGTNVATARQVLTKARNRRPTLVLWANTGRRPQAEVFAFNLRQIGIEVDVQYLPPDEILRRVELPNQPFDVVHIGWGADYAGDGGSLLEPLLGPNRIQRGAGVSPRWVKRVAAINRLPAEARAEAWAKLDAEIMREDPHWAPYAHLNDRAFISESFGCFAWHPRSGVDLAAACKQ